MLHPRLGLHPERVRHSPTQLVVVPWLGQQPEYLTLVDCGNDHVLITRVRGQQYADRRRRNHRGLAKNFDAVHHRHPGVADENVDLFLLEDVERLAAIGGGQHLAVERSQQTLQRLEHARIIINTQDGRKTWGTEVNAHRPVLALSAAVVVQKSPPEGNVAPGVRLPRRDRQAGATS